MIDSATCLFCSFENNGKLFESTLSRPAGYFILRFDPQRSWVTPMEIKVLSNDPELVKTLATMRTESIPGHETVPVDTGEPRFIPGALGSWWEIALTLGVLSIPARVAASLVANRIWLAYSKSRSEPDRTPRSRPPTVKLVLREGDVVAEVKIESWEFEAIRESVKAALVHVYRKQ